MKLLESKISDGDGLDFAIGGRMQNLGFADIHGEDCYALSGNPSSDAAIAAVIDVVHQLEFELIVEWEIVIGRHRGV